MYCVCNINILGNKALFDFAQDTKLITYNFFASMVAFFKTLCSFLPNICIHVFVCQDDIQTTEVFFIIKIIVIYYLFIHSFILQCIFLFGYCYFNCMHSNNFRRNMYYCLERKMQSLPHFSRKHNWDALT